MPQRIGTLKTSFIANFAGTEPCYQWWNNFDGRPFRGVHMHCRYAGALLIASLVVTPAMAGGGTTPATQAGTIFGSVTGAWILDAGPNEWQLFGPGNGNTPFTTAGPGGMGRFDFGYRWGNWDVSVGYQHIELGAGAVPPSSLTGRNSRLPATRSTRRLAGTRCTAAPRGARASAFAMRNGTIW